MLGQGCLGPFLENNFHPLKVGQKWVFVNVPKVASEVASEVAFAPQNPLFTHF